MAGNIFSGYRTPTVSRPPRQPALYAKPSGIASVLSGYGARSTFTDPYSSAGSQQRAGVGFGGAANTDLPTGPITTPAYPSAYPQYNPSAPTQYTPQPAQAPTAPPGFSFDLETDPILQRMHALAASQRAQAESGALALRKQLAIDYGDTGYGKTLDESTGKAAEQNPFSVFANLANQYQTGTRNLEENLNAHNLFYGGARINALANALTDYQRQQAAATGQEQQSLTGIEQNRVAALLAADQEEQQAYTDAYARALQLALAGGYGGGGGGGATYPGPNGGYTAAQINAAQGAPIGSPIRQIDTAPRSLENVATPGSYLRALMLRSQGLNQLYGLGR